jgi:hypothetical protein
VNRDSAVQTTAGFTGGGSVSRGADDARIMAAKSRGLALPGAAGASSLRTFLRTLNVLSWAMTAKYTAPQPTHSHSLPVSPVAANRKGSGRPQETHSLSWVAGRASCEASMTLNHTYFMPPACEGCRWAYKS